MLSGGLWDAKEGSNVRCKDWRLYGKIWTPPLTVGYMPPFNKYLLSVHHLLGTLLGAREVTVPQPPAPLLAQSRLGLHEPENLPQVAKHSSSQAVARPSQAARRTKLVDEAGRAQVGPGAGVQIPGTPEASELQKTGSCRGRGPQRGRDRSPKTLEYGVRGAGAAQPGPGSGPPGLPPAAGCGGGGWGGERKARARPPTLPPVPGASPDTYHLGDLEAAERAAQVVGVAAQAGQPAALAHRFGGGLVRAAGARDHGGARGLALEAVQLLAAPHAAVRAAGSPSARSGRAQRGRRIAVA